MNFRIHFSFIHIVHMFYCEYTSACCRNFCYMARYNLHSFSVPSVMEINKEKGICDFLFGKDVPLHKALT
jgi:hypothetical protein